MKHAKALLLLATLLLSLSCGSEKVLTDEPAEDGGAGSEPLFLPYRFESNVTGTTLDRGSDGAPAGAGEIVFENSGILQFSFRSLSRTTGIGRGENLQLVESSTALEGTGSGEETTGVTSVEEVAALESTERTDGTGSTGESRGTGSGESTTAGSSGETTRELARGESTERIGTGSAIQAQEGGEGDSASLGSGEATESGGSGERTDTLESGATTSAGSTEGSLTAGTSGSDETAGERTERTSEQEREGTLAGVETGSKSETTVADEKLHGAGGRESRVYSQSMRESITTLNVDYWEREVETIFNLAKYDRTLKHFSLESKAEYVKRLEEETESKPDVLRLVKTGPDRIEPGQPIEYGFELVNVTGPGAPGGESVDIENIVIIDLLDTGLLYDGEYEGEIVSGTSRFTFGSGDNSRQSRMPEFTTSAEWNDGKIAWMIPGVVRPGDRLTFTFRVTYFLDVGLIEAATPLTSAPGATEEVALLDPDRTAIRVIERNSAANWLKVSARTRDPDRTLVGYIPFDCFVAIAEDDVDRERKFMENNFAARIKEELASGKGKLRRSTD